MEINKLLEYAFILGQSCEAEGDDEAEDEYLEQLDEIWDSFDREEHELEIKFRQYMRSKGHFQ